MPFKSENVKVGSKYLHNKMGFCCGEDLPVLGNIQKYFAPQCHAHGTEGPVFDFNMLKTRFVTGSSAQTKAGYVLKYKGDNRLNSSRFEDCLTFIICRRPVHQRVGGGVAGVVGGRGDGLVQGPARGRDQGRGQARGQVRTNQSGAF